MALRIYRGVYRYQAKWYILPTISIHCGAVRDYKFVEINFKFLHFAFYINFQYSGAQ